LFGGEFRNLAARSTAVCSLRLQTSKRQSLRREKHHACNIAAFGLLLGRLDVPKKAQSDCCNFSIQTNMQTRSKLKRQG
jgi:hypothetical protein